MSSEASWPGSCAARMARIRIREIAGRRLRWRADGWLAQWSSRDGQGPFGLARCAWGIADCRYRSTVKTAPVAWLCATGRMRFLAPEVGVSHPGRSCALPRIGYVSMRLIRGTLAKIRRQRDKFPSTAISMRVLSA